MGAPRPRSRSSPGWPSAGSSARGAAPTSGPATSVRPSSPPSCPRRSSASASGSPLQPDARKRRRIDQRSRSWIFVTPALAFIGFGLLGPLIRTIYLSFHNRNGTESVGWDNYTAHLHQQELGELRQLGEHLHQPAVLPRPRAARARHPRRRVRRTADEPALRARSRARSVRSWPASSSCRAPSSSSIRGTIFNNVWWVIVVTSLATVLGLAVAVLADRARGREHGQVVDLPPDGDLVHRRRDHLALHVPGPRSLAEPDRGDERDLGVDRREHHVDDGEGDLARRPVRARARLRCSSSSRASTPSPARRPASPPGSCSSTPT